MSKPVTQLPITRQKRQAQFFREKLGDGIELHMVLIPAGSFVMGAPESEEGSADNERPQHTVTIPLFFMGKYPVTQAQWKAVAALPQIKQELYPDPSLFKGDDYDHPVEAVNWYEAVEFCDRLSLHTGRVYRLPSEAEWEYACRAGTTTPFHFGQTISTDLANYDGSRAYGIGSEGTFRPETTVVGSSGVANSFGLYDMHGNVWEWCVDHWHDSYEGAPSDGSAWSTGGNSLRVLRGGSWLNNPQVCRSAYRGKNDPVAREVIDGTFGFRVVCSATRTQ